MRLLALAGVLSLTVACSSAGKPASNATDAARPSILLVTLDTTRADAVGPEAVDVATPSFNDLAARGVRFRQAYATVPETLPSHASMMTGLYPAGHGVHENGRAVGPDHALVAERLKQAGYRTAAFVSSFTLARRFGLSRGFDVYNDEFPEGQSERSSRDTTDAAVAEIRKQSRRPLFLWVHYYDPHYPYLPPEPFRGRYADKPYLGEVAAMDQQLGRLVQQFEQQSRKPIAVAIVADHGEGLGDHGEMLHGNLLYQSTMHVPLLLVGPGVGSGVSDTPVSTRRIFHTILDWAGVDKAHSLLGREDETVLGEAMKPFLEYGWQPQVMSIDGSTKAIMAGKIETYDLAKDPGERHNLGAGANLPMRVQKDLGNYPVPSPDAARAPENLDDEARRRLASLGYVSAGAAPVIRKDAPRPADMTGLFELMDKASGVFAAGQYAAAIPLLERILAQDPSNLDASLRLATAHSSLGQEKPAMAMFRRAAAIAPRSQDVRTYLALHYARGKDWPLAVPLLEQVLTEAPERVAPLEALAVIRERQGRIADAIALRQKIYRLRTPSTEELTQFAQLEMSAGKTDLAIASFEVARARDRVAFKHDLELGVLYLAARRLPEARDALDRVPASHPEYPMALFKRAQVSVLLNEPDRASRIEAARQHADQTTRDLIARERLFR
jgi:arylsulfatase A-like enzyme/Tfp pilus assembly protein PilF